MKDELPIYIAGCLIITPAFIGILSGDVLVTLFGIFYGLVVIVSPSFSSVLRRFWRRWHKANFRVTNLLNK